MGVGWIVIFLIRVAEHGPPQGREQVLWLWSILTALIALIAPFRLRALYRLEPFQGLGLWQLSMADLLVTAFFTGLNLAFWRSASIERLLSVGIAASFLAGILFLAGTLTAARLNIERSTWKWLFATGYVARTYGALSVGGLVVLLILATFFGGNPFTFFNQIVFGFESEKWPGYFFRSGLICLPAGLAICDYVRRRITTSVTSHDANKVA